MLIVASDKYGETETAIGRPCRTCEGVDGYDGNLAGSDRTGTAVAQTMGDQAPRVIGANRCEWRKVLDFMVGVGPVLRLCNMCSAMRHGGSCDSMLETSCTCGLERCGRCIP